MRQNHVVSYVQARFTKTGYKCLAEPRITVSRSFRKSDLVVWKEEEASVLYVTIMRDYQHPDTYYKQKVEYYDMPEIRKWAGETTSYRFIHFAVVHNWRGIMSPMSAGFLSRHRFKYSDYKMMSLPVPFNQHERSEKKYYSKIFHDLSQKLYI